MIYKSYIVEENVKLLKEHIILFYGENLGLKNDFKEKIKVENKEQEIIFLNQDVILNNNNLLLNEIENLSLFNKPKTFILNQVNDKILELIEQIIPKIKNEKLYLFAEALDKKSKLRNLFEKSTNCGVIACYEDNEIGIKKIITNRLKTFTGLSPHNVNLIADNSSMDRAKLNNELDKIKIYFADKKIETEKLELLLNTKVNENFNNLKDEAFKGNKDKTNKLLSETHIDSDKIIYYLNIINQRLQKLCEIRNLKGTEIETKINNLKPPIFWKDKPNFIIQTRQWSKKKIKDFQEKTYTFEVQIKSNSLTDKSILFKKLIVDLCDAASA